MGEQKKEWAGRLEIRRAEILGIADCGSSSSKSCENFWNRKSLSTGGRLSFFRVLREIGRWMATNGGTPRQKE
jgi:hypothetical protein